jgi:cytochrome c oxidase cbb3-type subunit 4
MTMAHDDLLWLAQGVGLFYLVGLSIAVLLYVYWPSNKARFERAAGAILGGEDRPWR